MKKRGMMALGNGKKGGFWREQGETRVARFIAWGDLDHCRLFLALELLNFD